MHRQAVLWAECDQVQRRAVSGGSGTSWASPTQQLAQPWYQNLDVDYFHQFDHEYNGRDSTNFMKPGLNLSALNSTATITQLQRKSSTTSTLFKLTMSMPHNDVHTLRGCVLGPAPVPRYTAIGCC
eukprot:COSAG01_NODE_120_length_25409_cov_20.648572_9_plen_126_part_00